MENGNAEGENKFREISVLYEDDTVVVVNKPSGILVHSDGTDTSPTVVDWFLARTPEAHDVGEEQVGRKGLTLMRCGVVHRLDRETSGVMLLVKKQEAFEHFKSAFKDREAKKEYRAFVYGAMKERWGTIDRSIGRSAKDFRKRSAERGARGMLRKATTDWELIGQNDEYAYLKLVPKTGRTHQLRVHLKAIGRPIIQDTLYAPAALLKKEGLGFTRLALHAYVLTVHLLDGVEKRFIAPLPPQFESAETSIAT